MAYKKTKAVEAIEDAIDKYLEGMRFAGKRPSKIYLTTKQYQTLNIQEARMRRNKDKSWNKYPIGTKVHAITGGYWIRVKRGYKWCTGSTFPAPGADWSRIEMPKQEGKA